MFLSYSFLFLSCIGPLQLGHDSGDHPSHGESRKATVQDGDIIVLGSDGLFDNLFDTKIMSLIDAFCHKTQVKNQMVAAWPQDNKTQVAATISTAADTTPTTLTYAQVAAHSPTSSASSSSSTSSSSSSPRPSSSPPSPPLPSPFPHLSVIELQDLASHLVEEAVTVSNSRTAHTPFAANARKYKLRFQGGKPDDVTCVVAQVQGDCNDYHAVGGAADLQSAE